jgi:hypothetical protein
MVKLACFVEENGMDRGGPWNALRQLGRVVKEETTKFRGRSILPLPEEKRAERAKTEQIPLFIPRSRATWERQGAAIPAY